VQYFHEVFAPRLIGDDTTHRADDVLAEVVNTLFLSYLEQNGAQFGKSYAAWLEEQWDAQAASEPKRRHARQDKKPKTAPGATAEDE
jgi:hypothetical protein